jgi:hypothetical protein
LPWDVVQDSSKATYASARLSSRADELSFVKDELDPTVEKSGALDNLQVWDLIAVRNDLNSGLELSPALAAVLKQYIASHHAACCADRGHAANTLILKRKPANAAGDPVLPAISLMRS